MKSIGVLIGPRGNSAAHHTLLGGVRRWHGEALGKLRGFLTGCSSHTAVDTWVVLIDQSSRLRPQAIISLERNLGGLIVRAVLLVARDGHLWISS